MVMPSRSVSQHEGRIIVFTADGCDPCTLSGHRHIETPHSLRSVSFLMPTVLTPPSPDLVLTGLTNPGTLCVTCPSFCICSLSKSHDVSPAVPHGSIPILSFPLPPAWLQMGLSFVLILQCQLLLLPAQAAHHLLVYISGSHIKCSMIHPEQPCQNREGKSTYLSSVLSFLSDE